MTTYQDVLEKAKAAYTRIRQISPTMPRDQQITFAADEAVPPHADMLLEVLRDKVDLMGATPRVYYPKSVIETIQAAILDDLVKDLSNEDPSEDDDDVAEDA